MRINMKALHKAVAEKHNKIVVGDTYFLSHFHDKEGATVRVVSKSNKRRNLAGFFSIVNVEVLSSDANYYKIGEIHTVNASNLYVRRELASPANKWNRN